MARNQRGPSFDERVARSDLTPQQAESARATLLLAGLVHEMCDLIADQTERIAEQNERLAEQNRLLTEIRDRQPSTVVNNITGAAPAAKGKGGGGDVQLREPATPPPDPDDTAERGGSVAEPATSKPAARRPATTAAARTAPAKATKAAPAARRSTGRG